MKISLEKFIEKTKGTQVDVPWVTEPSKLKGQCVSLVQSYIQECLEQPAKARGNAKDWINTYVAEGLGYTVADQRKGDIIVFPNEADGYGHIAVYVGDNKIYDQNNARHDNGLAGICDIFSWDFVTLRPNAELVEDKPNTTEYLNLNPEADTWRIYPINVAPIVGNECNQLLPKKFGGLSYTIKGYTMDDVAIIETRDFGECQIYINTPLASITKEPVYGLVK